MKEKTPLSQKLCAFRCLISRPQYLILRSRNQFRGKFILSRKLHHFRGSRFSQCFILSTSPITHYQVRIYANNYLSNYQQCPLPLHRKADKTGMKVKSMLIKRFTTRIPVPKFIELLKCRKILVKMFCQVEMSRMPITNCIFLCGSLAGNLIQVSTILLCSAIICA